MSRGGTTTLVAAALALVWIQTAAAFDFVVTRVDDPAPDACNPGDCSLREAVIAANALAGPDRVVLGAGVYGLSRPGAGEDLSATGDLDVRDDLVIEGAGSATTTIVMLAILDRVIDANAPGIALEIDGVRLAGGFASSGDGGGLLADTGADAGSIALHDVVLSGNIASSGGGASLRAPHASLVDVRAEDDSADATAGGLRVTVLAGPSDRSLAMQNVAASRNSAATVGGLDVQTDVVSSTPLAARVEDNEALEGGCGGLRVGAGASLAPMEVSLAVQAIGNRSNPGAFDGGGGVCVAGCGGAPVDGIAVTLVDSTIEGNLAFQSFGGGVIARATETCQPASLRILRSTIRDNTATHGGGLYADGAIVTVDRSTFSKNSAGVRGGQIEALDTNLALRRSTIVAPSTDAPGSAIYADGVGGGKSWSLENSLVGGTCAGDLALAPASSIESPGDTCGLDQGGFAASNLVSQPSLGLGPLADNGGPTLTYLPQPGSVAIANPASGACAGVADQRGYVGVAPCDRGAVDSDAPEPGAAIGALAALAAIALLNARTGRGASRGC